jgi:hypothetical protein
VLEMLATTIRPEKKIKRVTIGKGRGQIVTVCRWYDSEDSTGQLLGLINTLNKVAVYKINIWKSVAFLYTNKVAENKGKPPH